MAEVRKHQESGDPITRAIRAAMGDPIRPPEPGRRADDVDEHEEPTAEAPASIPGAAVTASTLLVTAPTNFLLPKKGD